jgi:hypothetical protein
LRIVFPVYVADRGAARPSVITAAGSVLASELEKNSRYP